MNNQAVDQKKSIFTVLIGIISIGLILWIVIAFTTNRKKNLIYLTGFSEFASTTNNPTQNIVKKFESGYFDQYLPNGFGKTYDLQSCVLEVSIDAVEEYFDQIDLKDLSKKYANVHFIHMGLYDSYPAFRLEYYAHNNATFSVPDQKGNQPYEQLIETSKPLGFARSTDFPVFDMQSSIRSDPQLSIPSTVDVVVGTDAGTFVCNYLYYSSLMFTQTGNDLSYEFDSISSLFMHVPGYTLDENVEDDGGIIVCDVMKDLFSS
ncbi:Peptidase C15, pyroglutamyl peptidase I-like protein [Aduncisulcus paluster]|uniref:Peptidase C15, pyroglutamyl peptidase I-like protein n=1 Tax=Aduncisulcus paluster TaxID=2918883 RepID=A0ABQ5L0Y5_9EUKA|nr:Peptidase C15, pyroglutamyl peptidase I-like protein [Aduncisulcus paluster]